ncbi:MAG: cyclopropane fatty-acyl-phospholipid synthase-like methyltransferase [Polaribacter sp.]|jgi:cyclopropane fatty-acyl-phospholipid synthase-like methyltransferase
MKPFSQACENNKEVILSVISTLLKDKQKLLEIGSGTGQHAVYFTEKLPHLNWQTSDREENHEGINQWIDEDLLNQEFNNNIFNNNIERPIEIDALDYKWPEKIYDAVYSANTAHIMPWLAVESFFKGAGEVLIKGGIFILYGPFNYDGAFTSESNVRFEQWLKSVDTNRGIRDFEKVNQLAYESGLHLVNDYEMPANNRILVWEKRE